MASWSSGSAVDRRYSETSTKAFFQRNLQHEPEHKSPAAHELAAELARFTGESMTKAVTEAIRDRLQEKSKRDEDKLFAELMEIAAQRAAYPRQDERSLEEFLYDERGLPR